MDRKSADPCHRKCEKLQLEGESESSDRTACSAETSAVAAEDKEPATDRGEAVAVAWRRGPSLGAVREILPPRLGGNVSKQVVHVDPKTCALRSGAVRACSAEYWIRGR